MALHYCRYSNRVLAIRKSHWMMRLDPKHQGPAPKCRCYTALGPAGTSLWGDTRGYTISCITCSALHPYWQRCSVLTSATATLPLELAHTPLNDQLKSQMFHMPLHHSRSQRKYARLSWLQDWPQAIWWDECPPFQAPSAIPTHITPDQSCGQCLVSEPTQRTGSLLNRWENNSSSSHLQQITIHTACKGIVELVKPSDPLRLLLSYPKGDRDGLIKDCVHNHLLLSKSSLITKYREIVLCINQNKQPRMWLFWI